MDKGARNNLFVVGIFALVLVLSMYFVIALHEVSITHTNAGSFYVGSSDTAASVFTFTVNNTDAEDGANLTQVNVTIPTNFTFTYNSNYSNLTYPAGVLDFINTTTVLSWNSSLRGILNVSYQGNFSFNATTKPGNYSLIINTVRTNGTTSSTTLNVVVNDTTVPVLGVFSNSDNASKANGSSQSNIFVNISISEDYLLKNITFTLWNLTALINKTVYSLSNNWTNNTINWTGLYQYQVNSTYQYMVNVTNYANLTSNTGMYNITLNDSRAPEATITAGGYNNYSGKVELVATVYDGWVLHKVYFNITNGTKQVTFIEAGNTSTTRWNATLDTTNLTEGYYNVTIWANDTTGNKNNTNVANLTAYRKILVVDNSGPSVTLTSLSATTSSLGITITASDSLSWVNGACVVDRTTATVSGASTTSSSTQNITESGLDCGHAYTYTATCYNYAGKGGSSAATSFSTSDCGTSGSSGGSGGSGETIWAKDYKVTDEQFTEGYSKELGTANRMKIKIGGEDHHVGVVKLTETTATIEIASTGSVQVELDVGEDAKMDITEDGYYDVYVKLNGISESKADVFVQSIHELVPEGAEGVVSTTGEIVPEGEEIPITEGKSYAWIWIVIIIVVLIAIGAGIGMRKKK